MTSHRRDLQGLAALLIAAVLIVLANLPTPAPGSSLTSIVPELDAIFPPAASHSRVMSRGQ